MREIAVTAKIRLRINDFFIFRILFEEFRLIFGKDFCRKSDGNECD